jgi:nucleotide-binding universal stress UspA family protein
MYKKILVPTDGSKQSEKAGEYAVSLAETTGAEIIVLYVIDTEYLNALPQKDLRDQTDKDLREEGKKALEKFEAKIEEEQCNGKCKFVNFTKIIKEGKPADVILKTIEEEDIDQVVIAKSGKQGMEKLIIGSITEEVVKYAKVPVNVIS